MTADFSGYATRSDVRCTDGRTILAGAFEHQDGETVPLVWQHNHDEVTNVLGHVKLENVADGVRAHAYFNATPEGQHAKEMVRHGDVKWLSIFANQLREKAKQVSHGVIREVSLVLAGANPGATIDNVAIVHSDGEVDVYDEANITTGLEIEVPDLAHADSGTSTTSTEDPTLQEILDTLNDQQATAVNFLLSQALSGAGDSAQHSDDDDDVITGDAVEVEVETETEDEGTDDGAVEDEGTDDGAVEDDANEDADGVEVETDDDTETGTEESTDEEAGTEAGTDTEDENGTDAGDDAVQHDTINQEDNSMTHNLFDQANRDGNAGNQQQTLSHDDLKSVLEATIKTGSLKSALQDHALAHGIENIEYLFPDPKMLENSPNFLARKVEWVDKVLSSVRKTPFSRIRTVTADITADEARARGYIKGNMKNEEFFSLIKRETTPQTVYKKQKLDRDDVLDITDLDVVAWMKAEMKIMLDEEIAGAILIGDGRSNADDDKIKEDKIRPIASDAELYVTTVNVNLDDASSTVDELIDSVIENRKYYKGTGMPTFYTSEEIIGKFLTVKDSFGHRMYKTLEEVATALRVSEVVSVEIFTRVPDVVGILVNLADYSIGTDRGGQATMFDDFDLDYNKLRYLLETRLSGALTLPKSAIVFRKTASTAVLLSDPTAPTFDEGTNVVTIPTMTNVTYKNSDTNATLTAGAQAALTAGETLNVIAVADAGYFFATNANDEWSFTGV